MSKNAVRIQEVGLSDDFMSQYRNKQPKWGFDGLGYIIYLRTYSRKKADGTLERWDETVERITVGNYKIEAQRLIQLGKLTEERHAELVTEMERFYHLVFNLIMTPPGRGLWMSGTEYAEKVGDAENNCWGVSMRPQPYFTGEEPRVSFAPVFTFDQAMKGGGVGVNVQAKYVSQIPKVEKEIGIRFVVRADHPDVGELLEAGVEALSYEELQELYDSEPVHQVGDSRQGWAESLGDTIDEHYDPYYNDEIVFDISYVREKGADIKGFGGVASGPLPLVKMLNVVNNILNSRVGDFVTPTQWGDIIQLIGTCVVAGNVRRTAIILIGDESDKEYIQSKNYSLPENLEASQWRWASNNSVDIGVDTDRETLRNLGVNIYYNGEPGYVNVELSRNFGRIIDGFHKDIDGEVEVFNPCGEITLPNGSPCNLFEVNLPRIHQLIEAGIEGENLYEEAMFLATRYAYRITFRHYEWETTREVVYRHRRLGVGITGITDWVLLKFGAKAIHGFTEDGNAVYNEAVAYFLDKLYKFVRAANKEQSIELEANESIKVTTVKPSGTVSLLMGVSPGQHYHWAKFMTRRVRMSANAPLLPILMQCGYYIEPAVKGFNADGTYQYDYNTVVVEFPVKAPTADHPQFQSAGDVPLREQAALQAMLATYWSDNAVSATLSFHKAKPKPVYFEDGSMLLDKFGQPELKTDIREENAVIDEITDILDRYKGVIKSTSLLPHATDTYPQMPYEEISKDKYEKMVAKLTAKPWDLIDGSVKAEEEDFVDSSQECVGGSCPIR
jgi:ribonucleoside-triphosphate reductase